VRVDGERVDDQRMTLEAGRSYVLAVGKRRIVEVEVRAGAPEAAAEPAP
jgi:hypothetical protein